MDASILTGLLPTTPTAGASALASTTNTAATATPFANLLSLALGQATAATGTLSAVANSGLLTQATDQDAPTETGTAAATELAAAVLAAGALIQQTPLPVTPTVTPTTTAKSGTGVVTTATQSAVNLSGLVTTTSGQTNPATETATGTTAPATNLIATATTNAVQQSSTTADTTTATAAVASRVPAVIAQAPIVTDRSQALPTPPAEIGTGLIRPPVQEISSVGAPAAVSLGGRSAVRLDVLAGALVTKSDVAEAVPPVGFDDALDDARSEPTSKQPSAGPQPPPAVRYESAAPTAPTSPTATPPPAGQIADALVTHAQVVSRGGTHEFQMRLDPPELGEVKVKLIASGDRIQAEVLVGDDAVKRMIESQLSDLRQRLESSGIQVTRFDVSTDAGGGTGRQNPRWDGLPWGAIPSAQAAAEPNPTRSAVVAGVLDVTA